MRTRPDWRSLFLLLQLEFFLPCWSQQPVPGFFWAFDNSVVSTTLMECETLNVHIQSFRNDSVSFGVPPYYFMAMEVGGIPTVNLAGSGRNGLTWRVNHRAGSRLLLTMIDSNGTGGGVAPSLYDVVTGDSQSCFPQLTNSNFSITSNITGQLKTCQPWGVRIKGGKKPYNVTLAALSSPIITNVTMGPTDDVFTYIDRADPNGQLMISVSDAAGNFATGSPIVNTFGSTNIDCTGLVSSSHNSTYIDQLMAKAAAAGRAKTRNTAIASASSVVFGLLIIGALGYFLRKRRRRLQTEVNELMPRIYTESTPMSTIYYPNDSNFSSISSAKAGYSFTSFQYGRVPSAGNDPMSTHGINCPLNCECRPVPFTDDDYFDSPISRPRKTLHARGSSSSLSGGPSSGRTQPLSPGSSRLRELPSPDNVDIIIQHRDADDEAVVQELPPPYATRLNRTQNRPK